MKTLLTLALTTVTTVASSTAFAAPPVRAAAVFAPAPNPVQVDAPAKPVGKAPEPAGPGLYFGVGTGAAVIQGSVVDGVPMAGFLAMGELKLGIYVSRHLGFVAGVQAGTGTLTEGCPGGCSESAAVQLPLVAQYAFFDHVSGPYLEGGLALLSNYMASTSEEEEEEGASRESLIVSSPFDLRFGFGYRFGNGPTPWTKGGAYDLRFTVDAGRFDKLKYSSGGNRLEGEVQDSSRSTHMVFNLMFGMQLGS